MEDGEPKALEVAPEFLQTKAPRHAPGGARASGGARCLLRVAGRPPPRPQGAVQT